MLYVCAPINNVQKNHIYHIRECHSHTTTRDKHARRSHSSQQQDNTAHIHTLTHALTCTENKKYWFVCNCVMWKDLMPLKSKSYVYKYIFIQFIMCVWLRRLMETLANTHTHTRTRVVRSIPRQCVLLNDGISYRSRLLKSVFVCVELFE